MPLLMVSTRIEMKAVSSKIWTWLVKSFFYDDNHYANGSYILSFCLNKIRDEKRKD